MKIQSTGLNTVIPTAQGRHNRVSKQQSDVVSFSAKEQVVEKSLLHSISSFLNIFKKGANEIAGSINLPRAEKFDELISRLNSEGKKYEIMPATRRNYKTVGVYTSTSQNPVREYKFRKNNTLYGISKKDSNGKRLSDYQFKRDGSPREIYAYDVETNRTKGYAEFKRKGTKVVVLNPQTRKYFEEIGVFNHTSGAWVEMHPETYEILATHEKLPRVK